jgi:glyoxylase-like metal-dependent hydrolase (beta-lactamase superfamily II)
MPTFARARYIITDPEFVYWRDNPEEQQFGDYFSDSIQPVTDAGLVQLVETNHEICEEVRLESTPGHSPGHVSVRISSRGQQALITGDFIHHPCQMARPDWCSIADYDQEAARQTRRRMLAQLSEERILLIGTHFVTPTAGLVVRDGEAWRFDSDV